MFQILLEIFYSSKIESGGISKNEKEPNSCLNSFLHIFHAFIIYAEIGQVTSYLLQRSLLNEDIVLFLGVL